MLHISKPDMTVLIDRPLENGWIGRGYDPDDRRVILETIPHSGKYIFAGHLNRVKPALKYCPPVRAVKIPDSSAFRLGTCRRFLEF